VRVGTCVVQGCTRDRRVLGIVHLVVGATRAGNTWRWGPVGSLSAFWGNAIVGSVPGAFTSHVTEPMRMRSCDVLLLSRSVL